MRSIVSLVEARPETIAEDYGRLLDLAGLDALRSADGMLTVAAQSAPDGWFPGASSPPWQLAGVWDWLGRNPTGRSQGMTAAVGPDGEPVKAAALAWGPLLAGRGSRMAGDEFWTRKPWRSAEPGALAGPTDGGGFEVAAGLSRTRRLMVLAVPELRRDDTIGGVTRLLVKLALGRLKRPRGLSREEYLAEGMALTRAMLATGGLEPQLAAVLDGVVWNIGPGFPGRGPVTRNLLLAGSDPVAVDAVAARLAGHDPRRVPWLRMCAERGLGEVDPARIKLVGQPDLVTRDFGDPLLRTVRGACAGRGSAI